MLISKVHFVKSWFHEKYGRRNWSHDGAYLIDPLELPNIYPKQFMNWRLQLKAFMCDIFDNQAKLVHRLTPPEKVSLERVGWEDEKSKERHPCFLKLPGWFTDRYGISTNHYLVVLCVQVDDTPILPFELRIIFDGYDRIAEQIANRLVEYYEAVGRATMIGIYAALASGRAELANIAQYMLDGWFRYRDGDIEGAITQFRKSVEVLRRDLLPGIKEIEGVKHLKELCKKIVEHIDGLIYNIEEIARYLYGVLSIGGPHVARALTPRYTCLLAMRMLSGMLEYLVQVLGEGVNK